MSIQANYLREMHLQQWDPYTTSYHRYWTRAEKNRVYLAIRDRDISFVSHYMTCICTASNQLERVNAAIIMLSYLTKAHFLFQDAKFRNVVWHKMCEFEVSANDMLESINCIANWKEYDAQATLRNYLYELLRVIWEVREVLRGANDQTFKQD